MCGTELFKNFKNQTDLSPVCMLLKINKTADHCAVLHVFYCLPKKTTIGQRCRAALCPTNQLHHLHSSFSSGVVQKIVFLTRKNTFQKHLPTCVSILKILTYHHRASWFYFLLLVCIFLHQIDWLARLPLF